MLPGRRVILSAIAAALLITLPVQVAQAGADPSATAPSSAGQISPPSVLPLDLPPATNPAADRLPNPAAAPDVGDQPDPSNLPASPRAVTVLTPTVDGGLTATEVRATNPGAAAARIDQKPNVIASPVVNRAVLGSPVGLADGAARDLQWALNRVQAEDAWNTSTGTGIVVAVIDTGIDANHPDLAGALVPGFDTIKNRPASANTDPHGHGTHVAGEIVGHGVVTGIAPGAKVMPIRAMNSKGIGTTFDIVQGIIWAVNHGADVINMSLGSDKSDLAERNAIKWARARGVLVVAAAGNDVGFGGPIYPAAYGDYGKNAPTPTDLVIGVGAVDHTGERGFFSQRGAPVDVTAPGVRVLSTFPVAKGSYAWESGTSMASPYVAGIAALALSYQRQAHPERTHLEAANSTDQALRSSARDLGDPGVDSSFGSGDASAAGTLRALEAGTWAAMSGDASLSGGANGNAVAVFSTPAGTNVRAVLTVGSGTGGARGATNPSEGALLWSGAGGGTINLAIPGLSAANSYTLTIFTGDESHQSRTVAGLRPVTWSLKTPKSIAANSRSNIEVKTVLPSLGSGIPAGKITVSYSWKNHSKASRISPLDSALNVVPLPRSSRAVTLTASLDGGRGSWPSVSRTYVVKIRR